LARTVYLQAGVWMWDLQNAVCSVLQMK
jgi:hypothetical protein